MRHVHWPLTIVFPRPAEITQHARITLMDITADALVATWVKIAARTWTSVNSICVPHIPPATTMMADLSAAGVNDLLEMSVQNTKSQNTVYLLI